MDQIVVINKPKNWTSNDVVRKIKKSLSVKKVGHGGTLDPLATGVLIIGIGKATKQLNHHLNDVKKYYCEIEFGYATDTYDLEGEIINRKPINNINLDLITRQLEIFKLEYFQTPPIYSAIKKNGKPLYQYARENKLIKPEPRLVKLLDYKIIEFLNGILKLEIKVSKGFYVRSLANDLGLTLNNYATLTKLVRTASGKYSIDDAQDIESFINKTLKCII